MAEATKPFVSGVDRAKSPGVEDHPAGHHGEDRARAPPPRRPQQDGARVAAQSRRTFQASGRSGLADVGFGREAGVPVGGLVASTSRRGHSQSPSSSLRGGVQTVGAHIIRSPTLVLGSQQRPPATGSSSRSRSLRTHRGFSPRVLIPKPIPEAHPRTTDQEPPITFQRADDSVPLAHPPVHPFHVLSRIYKHYQRLRRGETHMYKHHSDTSHAASQFAYGRGVTLPFAADVSRAAAEPSAYRGTIVSGSPQVGKILAETNPCLPRGRALPHHIVQRPRSWHHRARGPSQQQDHHSSSAKMLTMINEFLRQGIFFRPPWDQAIIEKGRKSSIARTSKGEGACSSPSCRPSPKESIMTAPSVILLHRRRGSAGRRTGPHRQVISRHRLSSSASCWRAVAL